MKQYDVPELEDAELAGLAAPAPDAAYVEVAAHAHLGGGRLATLTYAVPAYLRGRLGVGQLIWAPLRQKLVLGVVTAAHDEPPHFAAREVHAPVEPEFRLHPRQLALAAWIAARYCCTLFEAALPMLPPGASRRSVVHLAATGAPLPLAGLSPKARRRPPRHRRHRPRARPQAGRRPRPPPPPGAPRGARGEGRGAKAEGRRSA